MKRLWKKFVIQDIDTPEKRKKFVKDLKIVLLFSIFILVAAHYIGYSYTDSVYFRIFFHTPVKTLSTGNYYVFKHNDDKYKGYAIKRIACSEGQTVSRVNSTVYCDDRPIVNILYTKDSEGKQLPQFEGFELLTDRVFMLGDHELSYDSRYFGSVPISSITREVIPLW